MSLEDILAEGKEAYLNRAEIILGRKILEEHGYRFDHANTFWVEAPEVLRSRIKRSTRKGPWYIWDPQDDENGWLLIGHNRLKLIRETLEMIDPKQSFTFTVILTRDTTESTILTVEAKDGQQAIDKALASDLSELPWEIDDTPNASSDVYVTDVSEEPTELAVRHEQEQQELTCQSSK